MAARLSLDADGHPRAPVRVLETFVEKGKGGETARCPFEMLGADTAGHCWVRLPLGTATGTGRLQSVKAKSRSRYIYEQLAHPEVGLPN